MRLFHKSNKNESYNELRKHYNTIVLLYENLQEKIKSELYESIINGDITLKEENESLKEKCKEYRAQIKELKKKLVEK